MTERYPEKGLRQRQTTQETERQRDRARHTGGEIRRQRETDRTNDRERKR